MERKRYPPPKSPVFPLQYTIDGSASIRWPSALGRATNSLMTDNTAIDGMLWKDDGTNTVILNDTTIDTCADCGVYYSPNAKDVGDKIQEEIYQLDPLGALAEIRQPDEGIPG